MALISNTILHNTKKRLRPQRRAAMKAAEKLTATQIEHASTATEDTLTKKPPAAFQLTNLNKVIPDDAGHIKVRLSWLYVHVAGFELLLLTGSDVVSHPAVWKATPERGDNRPYSSGRPQQIQQVFQSAQRCHRNTR